jgi:TonB family protein
VSSREFPLFASLAAHAIAFALFSFVTSGAPVPRDDTNADVLSIALEAPEFESPYITMEEPLVIEEPGALFPTLSFDAEEEPFAEIDDMAPEAEEPPDIDHLLPRGFPGVISVGRGECAPETATLPDTSETQDAAEHQKPEELNAGVQVWDTPASPLSGKNRPPRYPPAAVRKGIEGRVLLQLEVLADGTVGEVTVVESSGSDLLDEEAIRKVRTWRFGPARSGGRPVASHVLVPIRFELR